MSTLRQNIEMQLAEVELLQSMYPTEQEFRLNDVTVLEDLRDWLENDLFVELHVSQPRFELKLLEEQSDQVKDIIIDEADGLPMIEQRLCGVSNLLF